MAVHVVDPTVAVRPRKLRSRLAALLHRSAPDGGPTPDADRVAHLEDTRAVLEGARTVLESGWVQDAWYVARDRSGRQRTVGPLTLGLLRRSQVTGACLVGSVVQSSWLRRNDGHESTSGPALDALWNALHDTEGPQPRAGGAPEERIARVRDLTQWNDRPGRTRDEAIRLVEVAVTRTILDELDGAPKERR